MTGLIFLAMMVLIIWAEIKVFALIGAVTGALFVIVAVFATAAIGLRLFRKAGASTMRRFRDAASGGRPPVLEIADGSAIILAAGLLLMPGFVTDAIGLVLFVPGLRTVLAIILGRLVFSLTSRNTMVFHKSFNATPPPEDPEPENKNPSGVTIDGEFERKD